MKAKRRQELKTNDLAAWLADAGKSFSQWGVYVIGGVVVVVLIAVIGLFMSRAKAEAKAQNFADLTAAVQQITASGEPSQDDARRALESIDELIASAGNDDFKLAALLRKASIADFMANEVATDLEEGASDREVAKYLAEARAAYETIVNQYQDHALHYGRALFGLFQVEAHAFAIEPDPDHRNRAEQYLTKIRDDSRLNGTPFQMAAVSYLNELDNVFTPITFPERPEPVAGPTGQPMGRLSDILPEGARRALGEAGGRIPLDLRPADEPAEEPGEPAPTTENETAEPDQTETTGDAGALDADAADADAAEAAPADTEDNGSKE